MILGTLEKNAAGLTLGQLIDAAGDWAKETWVLTMLPMKGHLDRLDKRGKVRVVVGTRPLRWQRT